VGKTTMLNLLHGKISPKAGNIYINGHDINSDSENIKGLIGYVPQDDMLIEELTVFQNLYFNARLCFGDYTEEQLIDLVDKVLNDLDLYEIKDLQVGGIMNKMVSGGQRKRLNIGLELMREPVVLFVDEPTSGLSSFDSMKVMTLLKNQTLGGKLVFTIIHQPSSDIIKMFDRLWILDKGGYMIYDGDPVEALVYFKSETSQANASESECPSCGNIETDDILQIIEVKVIDNEGFPGKERQVNPPEWYEKYRKKMMPVAGDKPQKREVKASNFRVPDKAYQIKTFITRNLTRKMADKQYIALNLMEAPLLAFILAFISKYSFTGEYIFSANKNYPVFIFMSIIVALFMGLTVSAEEIFRDRKILEREKFLDLSRFSYLISKVNFLCSLSAIQTLSFVVVANLVLEVRGLLLQQWLVLFSVAFFGNMVGLNISAGMRSAVSIYILIPLILVPQLLLGGAMIKFDELHKSLSKKEFVPVIGDIMATRWAYEALSVEQFRSNRFEKPFFNYDMEMSQNNWYASFLIPELKTRLTKSEQAGRDQVYRNEAEGNLIKAARHIDELSERSGIQCGEWRSMLNYDSFNSSIADQARRHLDSLRSYFRAREMLYTVKRDSLYRSLAASEGTNKLLELKEKEYNDQLADIVLNRFSVAKIYDAGDRLLQKADPVFMKPSSNYGRAHFFAPYKLLGGLKISTLVFNMLAIWLMSGLLFISLYYNLLKKLVLFLESLHLPLWRRFGRDFLNIR